MKAYNFKDSSISNGLFGIHIFNSGNYPIVDNFRCNHTKTKIKAPID